MGSASYNETAPTIKGARLKQILRNPVAQFLIGKTIGFYMAFVGWTTRWRKVNRAVAERFWAEGGSVIACVWHGRFLLVHTLWKYDGTVQPAKFLVSASREGRIAYHATRTVGSDVTHGSSAKGKQSKGGFEAMREMLRHLEAGGIMGLAPDGPKGPRMRAKLGPIQLAKLSGAPMLPMAWSTKWRITLGSWDRFVLALPFGPGVQVWGEPISVARDADNAAMETARLALEAELLRITAEADRLCGAPMIEPAPAIEKRAKPEPAATVS